MHTPQAARVLLVGAALAFVFATGVGHAHDVRFTVGPDETLSYPDNLTDLADEHTTIFPPTSDFPKYLFFASSAVTGASGGAVVLQTSNLKSFDFADGYATQVMTPPIPFRQCKALFDPEFDLNYAAPGSVVQDPTRPPGNLIMIYEAENHCPGAVWQHDFYATVGFARSPDSGKTWPDPVDAEFGGTDRYPVLKHNIPEPTTQENPTIAIGNAIPSAIVTTDADGNSWIYVVYSRPGPGADGMLRIARAQLGGAEPITFWKWFDHGFTEAGIGGLDSPMLTSKGCTGRQGMGQISYSDVLGLYVLVYVCVDPQAGQAGWYYSTATSLELENWTQPQPIENSLLPIVEGCASDGTGEAFDGWYPSLMSPGVPSGHISNAGRIFFMNGCDRGERHYMSRRFTIAPPPQ